MPFLNEQSNKSSTEDIYIFDDTEDSEQEYFEGYVLNEDGNYVTYNQMINENLAEDLTASGKNVIIMGTQSITTVTNPPPSNGNNKTFRVGTTIIKDGKESWVGGDSEITIQFYKYEKSVLNKINIINTNYNSHSEYLFATFSRKQVKNQTPKILNFPLTTTVDVTPSVFANSKFCYVIYERDGWPTTERKTPFTIPNQNPFNIIYGSSNLDYYNSNHHNLIVPSVVDNASIKFSPYFN